MKTSIWDWKYDITCFQTGPCSLCDGLKLVANLTYLFIDLSLIAAAGMIIWGGIKILIPPGDSQKNFGEAKKIITSAVLGIIIVSTAWLLVNEVLHVLTGKPTATPWTSISCDTIK